VPSPLTCHSPACLAPRPQPSPLLLSPSIIRFSSLLFALTGSYSIKISPLAPHPAHNPHNRHVQYAIALVTHTS
jgi:hypothetical protein